MKFSKFQRSIALIIAFAMMFSSFPVSALEMQNSEDLQNEEALRRAIEGDEQWSFTSSSDASSTSGQAINGDVKWVENYPNGLFNFIGGQFNVSEANNYIEIAVARQGGTAGEVSVDLKAIDISAQYGKDYVIKIFENGYKMFGGIKVEENPDSTPLIESMAGDSEINIGIKTDENEEVYIEHEPAKAVTPQSISTAEIKEKSYTVIEPEKEVISQGVSIRAAKEQVTGIKSDRPVWKDADKNSVEALKAGYDEIFGSIPSAKTTLTFKEGEYIKYIYIVPIDDRISEDDEQVMLMLEKPTNGSARGENYMSTLVIKDNEPFEKSTFEFETDFAVIESNKAKATVIRKGGINRYASVVVGTVEDSAINGADYVAGLTELQFVPGMERQTVTVDILNNEYRAEGREFSFALDMGDENVNEEKAYCKVLISSEEDAVTPDEFNLKMLNRMPVMLESSQKLMNSTASSSVEKISAHGYSDQKGQWVIAPDDFINGNNNGGVKENDHIKIGHTGGDRWSHANKVKLYGANNLEFGFTNNGLGSYYWDYKWKFYYKNFFNWGWKKDWYKVFRESYRFTFEIDAPNSTRGVQTYKSKYGWTVHRSNLSEKQWNTNWIGIYSQADSGNTTNVNLYGIRLVLNEYNAKTLDSQKEKKITYELKSGQLSSKSEQEYSPGQLVIESIGSNVGNSQGTNNSRRNAKVYRSDRIRLTLNYGSDNPNGKYAEYKGFRIKKGNNWITYYNSNVTQDLDLNTEFFRKSGMLDAIRSGNIEIQPIFEKRSANADIKVNTQLGSCTNLGVGIQSKTLNNLFVGDKIINITAKPMAVAMTPNFTAKTGTNVKNTKTDNTGIKITDTLAGTVIEYTITDNYSQIDLNFGNPKFITAANPSVYDHRVTEPIYWVDGVKYTNHEQFSQKMDQVFKENQNPTIKMQFEYTFDDIYITDKAEVALRKCMFGSPSCAVLNIYKSDGTLRKTKNITPKDGKFIVEGKLRDLGWLIDDYASVSIIGSKDISGQKVQTRETVVNFLYNSANGVIVKSPDGKKVGSNVGQPVEISGANPTEEYGLSAYTSGNFITKWADYSVDANGDGFESAEEQKIALARLKALGYTGTLNDVRRTNIYYGNEFFMKPQFFNPTKILYNFEKRPMEASNAKIGFNLVQTGGTVLYPNVKQKPRPIKNTAVILAGKEIQPFNDEGMYIDIDPLYVERGYYLGKVFIDPYEHCFEAQQGINNTIEINTSEIMPPIDFTAVVNDKVVDFKRTQDYLDIENAITQFSYGFSNAKTGITPNYSKIRIYDNENEVIQTFETGPSGKDGKFRYSVNLLNAGVKPGNTMSICGIFKDGEKVQEFPEVPVGLTFSRKLTAVTVAASFKTPIQPVLKLIGKVNTAYDLGMDIDLEDKMTALDKYTDSKDRQRLPMIISFGFKKEFEKEFGDETQKKAEGEKKDKPEGDSEGSSEPRKGVQDKTFAEEAVDPNLSKQETISAIKKNQSEDAVKRGSGEGSASLNFNISLSLILEKMGGETYFNSVIIVATAEAQGNYSYTYVTPIGIPVTASISAEGTAVATLGIESHINKPFDEQYRFDGEGKISFNPKNYASYFKFVVTPSIEMSAGAGFSFLKLKISGRGDFDFNFNVPIYGENLSSEGSGGLRMSAALSIKILFVQKRWTLYKSKYISLFNYKNAMMLSNPYQDYMYETLGGIDEDDILSNDYLENKSEWMGEASQKRRMLSAESGENEKMLIKNAYPYPQTKLIKLNDTETMMLFVDDDGTRDVRNRAILKYSIGRNNSWSKPEAIDDDGTWDEAPNAFMVNGKLFIVWTNASRLFTEHDTEISILKTMDINAKWYDVETGKLSNETVKVTKTITTATTGSAITGSAIVGGGIKEECADLDPMIAFDEDTGRLLIYYTKIDYDDTARESDTVDLSFTETIPQKDEKLYGDIVNGYNVIAYRYADLNENGEFIWSTTYDIDEGFTPELVEQYYGQRFLDLAVPATIVEEVETKEVETNIKPEDDIYGLGKIMNTTQTVSQRAVYDSHNPKDPRVVDSDLITYNGLALYAYTMDFDANLKTVNDQKIYLQIYNFEEKSFTHPILLTNDSVQNTMPRFVRSKGLTYLYWLCNGEIAYMDLSTLVKSGLKKVTVEGGSEEIYVIDKKIMGLEGGKIISIAKEDENPIGEFQIASNDEGIYLLWSQFKTVLKDGIDKSSLEAAKPENIVREKQIFAAYTSPKKQRTNAAKPPTPENKEESNGQEIKEPSELISGDGYDWSKPVQITFEQGANYSDISFVVTDGDNLKLSYIKYKQTLDENGTSKDSETNRTLAINNIAVRPAIEFSDMIFSEKVGGNIATTEISLENTGVKPIVNTKYQTYIKADGQETVVEDWQPVRDQGRNEYILGGNTITVSSRYMLPDNTNEIILGMRFKDEDDNVIKETEIQVEMNSNIDIIVLKAELLSANAANILIRAKNIGDVSFNGKLEVKNNDTIMYNEDVVLAVDEFKDFDLAVDVLNAEYTDIKENEEGGIFDTLPLTVSLGDNKADASIIRSASKEITDALNNIKTFNLSFNGNLLHDSSVIKTKRGKFEKLDVNYELKDNYDETKGEADPYEIVLTSSDNNAISLLPNGTFALDKTDTVTVTATLKPVNTVVKSQENSYNVVDTSYLYPAGILKTKSVTISADRPSSGSSGSGTVGKNEILEATEGIVKMKVNEISKKDNITIKGDAVVTFDKNVIDKIVSSNGKDVEFKVSRQEGTDVFDISVIVDGKVITDFGNASIMVDLPYFLKDGQVSDNVVLYQTKDGKSVCLPLVVLDNERFSFNTRTLGKFEVKYNKVDFTDVSEMDWFYEAVNFASAREIVMGVGNNNFAPQLSVKRADFLTMAMRAFGIAETDNGSENFVDGGNTYYTGYLATAKSMGIVSGTGDNRFAPENEITREEMFVILYSIMNKLDLIEEISQKETVFTDSETISEYAKESINYLTAAKIVSGYGGSVNPKEKALRSETAQIMYKIMLHFQNCF